MIDEGKKKRKQKLAVNDHSLSSPCSTSNHVSSSSSLYSCNCSFFPSLIIAGPCKSSWSVVWDRWMCAKKIVIGTLFALSLTAPTIRNSILDFGLFDVIDYSLYFQVSRIDMGQSRTVYSEGKVFRENVRFLKICSSLAMVADTLRSPHIRLDIFRIPFQNLASLRIARLFFTNKCFRSSGLHELGLP